MQEKAKGGREETCLLNRIHQRHPEQGKVDMQIRREKQHSRYTVALYTRPLSHCDTGLSTRLCLLSCMCCKVSWWEKGWAVGRDCGLRSRLSPDPDEKMSLSHFPA